MEMLLMIAAVMAAVVSFVHLLTRGISEGEVGQYMLYWAVMMFAFAVVAALCLMLLPPPLSFVVAFMIGGWIYYMVLGHLL